MPKGVKKQIRKLPKEDQSGILVALLELAENPWSGDIAKKEGEENVWRRRVGHYRIIYSIYKHLKLLDVEEVKRRTSSTY